MVRSLPTSEPSSLQRASPLDRKWEAPSASVCPVCLQVWKGTVLAAPELGTIVPFLGTFPTYFVRDLTRHTMEVEGKKRYGENWKLW